MDKIENVKEKEERIVIAFFKGDIINDFKREKDGKQIGIIQFPKSSKYSGYVWYWPKDWIYSKDTAKNDKARSFHPDKRWIRVKPDEEFKCVLRDQNPDTKKWEAVDEVVLTAEDVREYMKRPMKKAEA